MPRANNDDNGSETQEGATHETLKADGYHFVHVKQHGKAIESFTKALELKGDDEHCLVTRSKCHLQMGNSEAALADAEAALEINPKLIKGFFQKAEALYQNGNFETALVFYHRGHKLRPELQEFRLGIQKSQEAINNSIGSPDSVKLEANKGDMSYFYKQEEEAEKAEKKKLSELEDLKVLLHKHAQAVCALL